MNNPNEDRTKPTSNLNYDWYVPLHISTGETFESLWMMNNKDEQTFDLRLRFRTFWLFLKIGRIQTQNLNRNPFKVDCHLIQHTLLSIMITGGKLLI